MKSISTTGKTNGFKPLINSASVQAAIMVLRPGQSSSDRVENEHPGAEQWLLVISGAGRAKTPGRSIALTNGSLVLIEKKEPHQITNTGRRNLVTINFYSPPAYDPKSNVLPSVSRNS